MKITLLIIAFTITSSVCVSGQARLGSTASEIKSEFWENKYNLESKYDSDGDFLISIATERATVIYYSTQKRCAI